MPTADVRPAATIVVIRPEDAGIATLMLRRSAAAAFMPGLYVFPGGRVDAADMTAAAAASAAPAPGGAGMSPVDELAHRLAAVRELREEAGLVVDDLSALIPIAHWVTPPGQARRYDTRFFLAGAPADQDARHDGEETTEALWIGPAAALERSRAGALALAPPTWTILGALARYRSVGDAMAWAARVVVHRVTPELHTDDRGRFMAIPGDPLLPAPPDVEVPAHTRFAYHDARGWLPRED